VRHRVYAIALTALALAFCGRVLAQLVQLLEPTALLPPFEAWHSGALPYGLLLTAQVLLVFLMVRIVFRMARQRSRPHRR
jgi:hypothetical protein